MLIRLSSVNIRQCCYFTKFYSVFVHSCNVHPRFFIFRQRSFLQFQSAWIFTHCAVTGFSTSLSLFTSIDYGTTITVTITVTPTLTPAFQNLINSSHTCSTYFSNFDENSPIIFRVILFANRQSNGG